MPEREQGMTAAVPVNGGQNREQKMQALKRKKPARISVRANPPKEEVEETGAIIGKGLWQCNKLLSKKLSSEAMMLVKKRFAAGERPLFKA
ncbi:MAG: hypothetical protein Q4B17_00100 [Lautropia sp.]|nr:hypothetical protein [Lautropia sp.]